MISFDSELSGLTTINNNNKVRNINGGIVVIFSLPSLTTPYTIDSLLTRDGISTLNITLDFHIYYLNS